MKKLFQVGLPLALVVVLGTYSLVSAQGEKPRPGRVEAEPPVFDTSAAPPAAPIKHFLQGTYLISGNGFGASISAATFTAVDAASTVTCPGPTGTCTIAADQHVETRGSVASNDMALCLYVDGSPTANSCFFTADTPSDGTFVQSANISWSGNVGVGTHTVQTFIYSTGGCTMYQFNLQYSVYKP
jgi:hypothetical protein